MPIETVIRPILDTVLDAVVVMDRAGTIRAWNQPLVPPVYVALADEQVDGQAGEHEEQPDDAVHRLGGELGDDDGGAGEDEDGRRHRVAPGAVGGRVARPASRPCSA